VVASLLLTLQGATGSGSWTGGGTIYTTTQAQFIADLAGPTGTATPNEVTIEVTANANVTGTNLITWAGAAYESNAALAQRDTQALQALSPNGPADAYDFMALTAASILAATPDAGSVNVGGRDFLVSNAVPIALRCGRVIVAETVPNDATGVTQCIVAGENPASSTLGQAVVSGSALNPIAAATNATPIVITTGNAHGMITGDTAIVSAVEGNTAANGTWPVVVVDGTHFSLVGSVGNGAWTATTGSVECGDVGAIDSVIQANVVPTSQGAAAVSALAFPVTVAATVYVPSAYAATYAIAVASQLQAFANAQPLGGAPPPATGGSGTLLYNDVLGTIFDAGSVNSAPSYVKQITGLLLNGSGTDLTFPTAISQLLFPTPAIAVVGV